MNTHELTGHMKETRELIIDLTGLSEDQLNAMMFEEAEKWLLHIGADHDIAMQFMGTSEFWGFYKKLWHQADRDFIRAFFNLGLDDMPAVYYQDWHSANSRPMNTHYAHTGYHSIIKTLTIKR